MDSGHPTPATRVDKPHITQTRLKELLDYNEETGVFTWRVSTSNRAKVGQVAGWLSPHGYIQIRLDGRLYAAHRLAWFYVTGECDMARVDHKDHNPRNNRFNNLRSATASQNLQNIAIRVDNRSGFTGVKWRNDRRRWSASLTVRGKVMMLGCYGTAEEAFAAYLSAKEKHCEFFVKENTHLLIRSTASCADGAE